MQKGFTLIELLVVIAIIALLLSIIVPALGKAKMYAEEILCKTNLHQYQIATELYCNQNKEKMPNAKTSLYSKEKFSNETQRYCRWHNPEYNLDADRKDTDGTPYAGPYWPYLATTKANICPLFKKIAIAYDRQHMEGNGGMNASQCIGGRFDPQFSYSMNSIFNRTDSAGNPDTVKKSQVASPSQTFLWAEENMWTLTNPLLSRFVLNDNSLVVNQTNPTDCFGSYHKISKGKLSGQQSTRRYDTGVANVLMADGSLSWLTPQDSYLYKGKIR
jgi:prepilin-type N-terminal cleavage/methylation domain-containing protein/prepilin-type processing-associated H-X9-DG protein